MNELQRKQFSPCVRFVEEVVTGQRKGIPESRYVVEIPRAAEYWSEESQEFVAVPSEFTGHWMLRSSGDLRYAPFHAVWLSDDWVKCERKRVETFEWVEATRPVNCRNRLRDEGQPYPRSGCEHCKTGGLTGCPFER